MVIYRKYVVVDAPLQINISASLRQRTARAYEASVDASRRERHLSVQFR